MQPRVEHIPARSDQSFICRSYATTHFRFNWHLHPELELTWIVSGRGQRYVGDRVEPFREGDLVLLGPNLPHTWESQPSKHRKSAAVVVQFLPDRFGAGFLETPELRRVRRLLDRAASGIAFRGPVARLVGQRLEAMVGLGPLPRLTGLLECLDELSRARTARTLASAAYYSPDRLDDQRRIDKVRAHLHHHAAEPLTLPDVARLVGLTPTSFARFFKRSTGQTFIEHLHEQRVARACRLLVETDAPITDICFRSGFGTLSNFNRTFLRLKGETPRHFRQRFAGRDVTT